MFINQLGIFIIDLNVLAVNRSRVNVHHILTCHHAKLASEAKRTMVTTHPFSRPENKKLFVFCKGPQKNRVGRLLKK